MKKRTRNKFWNKAFLLALLQATTVEILIAITLLDRLPEGFTLSIDAIVQLSWTDRVPLVLGVAFPIALVIIFLYLYYGWRRSIDHITSNLDHVQSGQFEALQMEEDGDLAEIDQAVIDMSEEIQDEYLSLQKQVDEKTEELAQRVDEIEDRKNRSEKSREALMLTLRQVAQAQAKDAAVLASIGEGMVVTDDKANVQTANAAAAALLRTTPDKLGDLNWLDDIQLIDDHGESMDPKMRPTRLTLFSGQTATDTKHSYIRTDGETLPVSITSAPVIVDGDIMGAVTVFRDTTEERQLDQAKSEFISLASHQLRTPLTTVQWYIEILRDDESDALTTKQQDVVEEIYKGNTHLISLVNALLNVSRIDVGTFAITPKPTNVITICENVIDTEKPRIEKKKLDVKKDIDASIPMMDVDPLLVEILFYNLLSNAVKYTPDGGTIRIVLKKDETDLLYEVHDSGIGIPAEQQEKIFSKLFRAQNVQNSDIEGTGLGLYMVKSIVDAAHGHIRFESTEGEGTTFFVSIPLTGMKAKKGNRELSIQKER